MEPLSEQEGVAGIALLAMFADGIIAPEEDDVLRERLSGYPFFMNVSEAQLGIMLERLERYSHEHGGESLLIASAAAARPRLAATAFDIALDIIEADGEVVTEESTFLKRLRALLALK